MPYPNVPAHLTDKMDRCVDKLVAEGKTKDSAIAICHSSIVGDKKKADFSAINVNFYGDYWKTTVSKDEEEENSKITKGGEKPNMAKEKTKEEIKVEEVKKEEVKPEEVKTETEEVKPEEVKEEKLDKVSSEELLKTVLEKVEKLSEALGKKEEPASAKGATSEVKTEKVEKSEEAPKEKVVETSKEEKAEVKKEDASPEAAEKNEALNKVSDSLVKVTDQVTKVADQVVKLDETLKKLDERLVTVEKQPMPSKVGSPIVVKKDTQDAVSDSRIDEINKELAEIENLQKTDLTRFQVEKKWEKAFALIDEKNAILMSHK